MQFLKSSITFPIKFVSAGQFLSGLPWKHSKRVVDTFEIMIGVNETLYIERERVRYELKPGEILLLPPGQVHQGYAESEKNISFFWCHFYCQGFHELIDHRDIHQQFGTNPLNSRSRDYNTEIYIPLYFSPPSVDRINILFHQLLHVANADYYTNHYTHYLLTSLLIEISQQAIYHFFIPAYPQQKDVNLARIMEWIRVNAMNDISVSSVAERFNYNKDYLSRLFKQKIGTNLRDYIHGLKMSKARELLTNTNMSIKEISGMVGFHDEKYFMKVFKKYEKMTPSEFRNAYYRTHMNSH